MNSPHDPLKVVYEEEFTGPTKELRMLGMLSYVPCGFIVAYVLQLNDQPFVLFHIKQGFTMLSIAIILSLLPITGTFWLAFFLYLIFGSWHGYRAYQWEKYQMGWVSAILEGIKNADNSWISQQNTETQTKNNETKNNI